MQTPSIQSFYQKEVTSSPPVSSVNNNEPGSSLNDGFTDAEVKTATHPLPQIWIPKRPYQERTISELQVGRDCVKFRARIVNFSGSKHPRPSLSPGYIFFVLKDDTGAIAASCPMRLRACSLSQSADRLP